MENHEVWEGQSTAPTASKLLYLLSKDLGEPPDRPLRIFCNDLRVNKPLHPNLPLHPTRMMTTTMKNPPRAQSCGTLGASCSRQTPSSDEA